MRKKEIKCPYCGSKAKLVHFYDIYGKDATHPERYAWACARFPQCDSYVSTIKGSTETSGNTCLMHNYDMSGLKLTGLSKKWWRAVWSA